MVWKATKASGKSPFPASGHSITARDKQVYVFAGNTNKTTHANLFILNTGRHIPPPPSLSLESNMSISSRDHLRALFESKCDVGVQVV